VYKSIIALHFEYCSTLVISMGETQLCALQRAQNRAMRVILHCDRYTKIEDMLRALRFMSIRQRLHYACCIFVYKILHSMSPVSLRNKIEIVGSSSQRCTRQAGKIALKLRKTKSAQKSVFYEGFKLYNALSSRIRDYDKLNVFKRELKEYVLNTVNI